MDRQAFQHQMQLVKERLSAMPAPCPPTDLIVDNVCDQLRELRARLDTLQAACQTFASKPAPVTPSKRSSLVDRDSEEPLPLDIRTRTLEEKFYRLEQRLSRLESPVLTPSTTADFGDADPFDSPTHSSASQRSSHDIPGSRDEVAQLSDKIAQKDAEICRLQDKLSEGNRIIAELQQRLKEHGVQSSNTNTSEPSEVPQNAIALPLHSLLSEAAKAPRPTPKKLVPIPFGGPPSDQTYLEFSTPPRLKGQQLPGEAMRASLWSNQPGPPRLPKFGEASPLGNSWRRIASV